MEGLALRGRRTGFVGGRVRLDFGTEELDKVRVRLEEGGLGWRAMLEGKEKVRID